MKKNFLIIWDGIYTSIETTLRPIDNVSCFKTLKEAKKEILSDFKYQLDNYKEAVKRIKAIKKD